MEFEIALNKAEKICVSKECCSFDINEKLKRWDVAKDDIDKIIRRLEDEKFIDNSRYAGMFARDKFKLQGWGKNKIYWHLQAKRIDSQTIKNAVESISDEESNESVNKFLEKAAATVKESERNTMKHVLIKKAMARGFEIGEIMKNVDKYVIK